MTPILKVITEYCGMWIDDIRLSELAGTNPALYARKMWGFLQIALPLFNYPSVAYDYIMGTTENPKITEPNYDSYRHTVDTDKTTTFTISLGDDYKGYSVFNASIVEINGQEVYITPTNIASYNATTGVVTITASASEPVAAGTILDFDFYTDGNFANTLSPEMLNIIGECFKVVWQNRFNTDWLSIVSKVEDKSFFEQNRANKQNANTAKLAQDLQWLAGEMRRYEQNLYYRQIVPPTRKPKL